MPKSYDDMSWLEKSEQHLADFRNFLGASITNIQSLSTVGKLAPNPELPVHVAGVFAQLANASATMAGYCYQRYQADTAYSHIRGIIEAHGDQTKEETDIKSRGTRDSQDSEESIDKAGVQTGEY